MVTFDRLHTYERPRNKMMLLLDTVLKILVISGVALIVIWIVSEILFKGQFLGTKLDFLKIANPSGHHPTSTDVKTPVPVHFAYIGLAIGLIAGSALYIAPIIINLILAPPGGRLRTLVVDDDQYADTTYECGESPIGSGQAQVNLQYYSFALVFIMFDIITALTLMFAVVFSFGLGTTGSLVVEGVPFTPSINDVILQVVAVLIFILSPLLVLGLWLRKKAILWQ